MKYITIFGKVGKSKRIVIFDSWHLFYKVIRLLKEI